MMDETTGKMKMINFLMSEGDCTKLAAKAKSIGVSKSDVLRMAFLRFNEVSV